MPGKIEKDAIEFDGKTALWFFTVHAKQDWNEVSFRRGFVRCPECYERNPESPDLYDVCSIFPANVAVPEGIGLHWCPCGTIWLSGYGEPKVLMTSREHMELPHPADDDPPMQKCENCDTLVAVSDGWSGGPVWCLRCYNEQLGG